MENQYYVLKSISIKIHLVIYRARRKSKFHNHANYTSLIDTTTSLL